jgi:hypothetical protein
MKRSSAAGAAMAGVDSYDTGCCRIFGTFHNPSVSSSGRWVYWHVLETSGYHKVVK